MSAATGGGSTLMARVEREGKDGLRVLAPAVGWWWGPPHAGAIVGPASPIGTLRVLNRRFDLLLPDGAAGTVQEPPRDKMVPVDYGQTLFLLAASAVGAGRGAGAFDPKRPGADGLPPDTWAVVAPTDGVFYRRPSPESAAFVEQGSALRTGQPIGLVEVMKTFNQILYGGTGLPDQVEVVEILCEDAEEVEAGQRLVIVKRS